MRQNKKSKLIKFSSKHNKCSKINKLSKINLIQVYLGNKIMCQRKNKLVIRYLAKRNHKIRNQLFNK